MKKRTRTILIFALAGAVASLGLVAVSWWYLGMMSGKLTERQQEIANTLAHLDAERALVRLVASSEEERALLQSLILRSDDVSVIAFLSYIEALGDREGVSVKTNGLTAPGGEGSFGSISVALTVDGLAENTARFIALLEVLPYRSFIEEVHIEERATGLMKNWQADVKLQVTTYTPV